MNSMEHEAPYSSVQSAVCTFSPEKYAESKKQDRISEKNQVQELGKDIAGWEDGDGAKHVYGYEKIKNTRIPLKIVGEP